MAFKDYTPTVNFLKHLYRQCGNEGWLCLRFLPGPDGDKQRFVKFSQIDKELPGKLNLYANKKRNLYFGVALRKEMDGTEKGILIIPALWLEHDEVTQEVQAKLDDFPLKPSIIIQSSLPSKKHFYWILKTPLFYEHLQEAKTMLKRIASHFGGDMSATDASHVLRLPDTLNVKHNPPLPVILLESNDNLFELSQFDPLVPALPKSLAANDPGWEEELLKGLPDGQRTEALEKLAGRYIGKKLLKQEVLELLALWNTKNTPPLDDDKIYNTVESIWKTHYRNHPNDKPDSINIEVRDVLEIDEEELEEHPIIYPKNSFKGVIKDFADLYSENLESPYEFWVFAFATMFGCMFSKNIKFNSELPTEPRLFTQLIGESANTHKSETRRRAKYFMKEFLETFKLEGTEDSPSKVLHIIPGVSSDVGLIQELKKGPVAVLCWDEMALFTQKAGISGSGLLQVTTQLFEDTEAQNLTKDNRLFVRDAHLAMIGCSTKATWESMFTESYQAIGFLNRLFLVPGEGVIRNSNPPPISNDDKHVIRMKLLKIREKFVKDGERTTVHFSKEAADLDNQYYLELKQDKSDTGSRLDGYMKRLLQIMALDENTLTIDINMVERAMEICRWQRQVRLVHQPVRYANAVAMFEDKIRNYCQNWRTEGKIKNSQKHNIKVYGLWNYEKAMKNLASEFETGTSKGRKTFRIKKAQGDS
jgi:hypothetical protein